MARNDKSDNPLSTQLERDLADLRLLEIARCYREVLDEAVEFSERCQSDYLPS